MTGHRKRPRDPSQLAKLIVDIAAGEVEDQPETKLVKTRQQVAELGGKKRASLLSKKRRVDIAKKAAKTRWKSKVPS